VLLSGDVRVLPLLFLTGLSGCCTFSAPPYRGQKSDHFDGKSFVNPNPEYVEMGLGDAISWMLSREPTDWPDAIEIAPQPKPPAIVDGGRLRATFINHATVLIQMDGVNVLTDPIYSDRPSPVSFAGPHRIHPPGVKLEDLPKIHLVVISHSHYDHLDLPTLRALFERDQPRVVVGLGTAQIVRAGGVPKVRELDWWQGFRDPSGLRVTSAPVQHFANRGLCDRNGQLWTGWVLEGPSGKVYVAGDTGYGPHFAAARARFGRFRLAVLPIGSYKPQSFMGGVHMDPAGAVRARADLGAQTGLGMHFGTFRLGDEGPFEAGTTLAAERAKAGLGPDDFWVLAPGEGRDAPPVSGPEESPTGLGATAVAVPSIVACRDTLEAFPSP